MGMPWVPWVTRNRLLFPSKWEPSWVEDREAAFLQCGISKCVQVSRHQGVPGCSIPWAQDTFHIPECRHEPPGAATRGKAWKEVQAGHAGLWGMMCPDAAAAAGAGTCEHEPTLSPLPQHMRPGSCSNPPCIFQPHPAHPVTAPSSASPLVTAGGSCWGPHPPPLTQSQGDWGS